jgi:hypothetical protein
VGWREEAGPPVGAGATQDHGISLDLGSVAVQPAARRRRGGSRTRAVPCAEAEEEHAGVGVPDPD